VKLYGNPAFGGAMQGTGGSNSIAGSFMRYRQAGAMARSMLVAAAADEWKVPAGEIKVANGVLTHGSGRRATFGELAAKAATMPAPATVKLKEPKDFKLIGKRDLPRLDNAEKTTGRQNYTIDVRLPGMLTAVVARPPKFGETVKSFDATEAKKVKGVTDVVQIPRGVAIVARDTWAAMKGREALKVEWDDSKAEKRSTAQIMAEYRELAKRPNAAVARKDGDADAALAGAARTFEAVFEFPYLAHAAMEPMDAVARKTGDLLEVWGGHQMPDIYQGAAAQIAGLKPEQIRMHVMQSGGGFGRRAVMDSDVIVEAVATAKAIGWKAPVKVLWTREDDMTGGRYRPLYVHTIKAGIDGAGNIVAWKHRIVGQSILGGSPFAMMIKDGVDATSVEGASNLPYAIPNLFVDLVTTELPVPVLWWRSVGSTHTAYSTELMIDMCARAANKDPVEYRLAMLQKHPRHLAALKLAADKAGWGKPAAAGLHRGVSVHESFNTVVAEIAEVRLVGGKPKVERVVCGVDCGLAVNPDIIEAQVQGGVGFGLGAILRGQITLDGGEVQETNYDTYEPLRISEMPKVEVHVVPSTAPPTGIGEPGVPPIGPAVANALLAATGRPVYRLPIMENLPTG
jgi:isoquinoline 1-oxidoreductase beta subunit